MLEDTYTLEEIKDRITHVMDEMYLIETLGLDIHTLVDILEDYIIENYDKILDVLDE